LENIKDGLPAVLMGRVILWRHRFEIAAVLSTTCGSSPSGERTDLATVYSTLIPPTVPLHEGPLHVATYVTAHDPVSRSSTMPRSRHYVKVPLEMRRDKTIELKSSLQLAKHRVAAQRDLDRYSIGFATKGDDYLIARTTPPAPAASKGKSAKKLKKSKIKAGSTSDTTLDDGSHEAKALPVFGRGGVSDEVDLTEMRSSEAFERMSEVLWGEARSTRRAAANAGVGCAELKGRLADVWPTDHGTPLFGQYINKWNEYHVQMEYADRLQELLDGTPDDPSYGGEGTARLGVHDAGQAVLMERVWRLGDALQAGGEEPVSDVETAVLGRELAVADKAIAQWGIRGILTHTELDLNNDGRMALLSGERGVPVRDEHGELISVQRIPGPIARREALARAWSDKLSSEDRIAAASAALKRYREDGQVVPDLEEILGSYTDRIEAEQEEEDRRGNHLQRLYEYWSPRKEHHLVIARSDNRGAVVSRLVEHTIPGGSADFPPLGPHLDPDTRREDTKDEVETGGDLPQGLSPDQFKPHWTDKSAARIYADSLVELAETCRDAAREADTKFDLTLTSVVRGQLSLDDAVREVLDHEAREAARAGDVQVRHAPRKIYDTWARMEKEWDEADKQLRSYVEGLAASGRVSAGDKTRLDTWLKLAERSTDPRQYRDYLFSALDQSEWAAPERGEMSVPEPWHLGDKQEQTFVLGQTLSQQQERLEADKASYMAELRRRGITTLPATVEGVEEALMSRTRELDAAEEERRLNSERKAREEEEAEQVKQAAHAQTRAETAQRREAMASLPKIRAWTPREVTRHAKGSTNRTLAQGFTADGGSAKKVKTPLQRWQAMESTSQGAEPGQHVSRSPPTQIRPKPNTIGKEPSYAEATRLFRGPSSSSGHRGNSDSGASATEARLGGSWAEVVMGLVTPLRQKPPPLPRVVLRPHGAEVRARTVSIAQSSMSENDKGLPSEPAGFEAGGHGSPRPTAAIEKSPSVCPDRDAQGTSAGHETSESATDVTDWDRVVGEKLSVHETIPAPEDAQTRPHFIPLDFVPDLGARRDAVPAPASVGDSEVAVSTRAEEAPTVRVSLPKLQGLGMSPVRSQPDLEPRAAPHTPDARSIPTEPRAMRAGARRNVPSSASSAQLRSIHVPASRGSVSSSRPQEARAPVSGRAAHDAIIKTQLIYHRQRMRQLRAAQSAGRRWDMSSSWTALGLFTAAQFNTINWISAELAQTRRQLAALTAQLQHPSNMGSYPVHPPHAPVGAYSVLPPQAWPTYQPEMSTFSPLDGAQDSYYPALDTASAPPYTPTAEWESTSPSGSGGTASDYGSVRAALRPRRAMHPGTMDSGVAGLGTERTVSSGSHPQLLDSPGSLHAETYVHDPMERASGTGSFSLEEEDRQWGVESRYEWQGTTDDAHDQVDHGEVLAPADAAGEHAFLRDSDVDDGAEEEDEESHVDVLQEQPDEDVDAPGAHDRQRRASI